MCTYTARAMSYLEVYRLSRHQLRDIAAPFPVGSQKMRWAAVRLALLRRIKQLNAVNACSTTQRATFDRAFTQASVRGGITWLRHRPYASGAAGAGPEDSDASAGPEDSEKPLMLNEQAPTLSELGAGVNELRAAASKRDGEVEKMRGELREVASAVQAVYALLGGKGTIADGGGGDKPVGRKARPKPTWAAEPPVVDATAVEQTPETTEVVSLM